MCPWVLRCVAVLLLGLAPRLLAAAVTVTLTWDAPTSGTVQQYRVDRQLAQGAWQPLTTTTGAIKTTNDTLAGDGQWCYRVLASYADGLSDPSNIACITVSGGSGTITPPPGDGGGGTGGGGGGGGTITATTLFLQPFTGDSFWKKAFGSGAILTPANLSATRTPNSNYAEEIMILNMQPLDPTSHAYRTASIVGTGAVSTWCGTGGIDTTIANYRIAVPRLLLPTEPGIEWRVEEAHGHSIAVFCDLSGFLYGVNTCREAFQARRCGSTYWSGSLTSQAAMTYGGTADWAFTGPYSIAGNGLPRVSPTLDNLGGGVGAHQGGGIVALGGVVRDNELITAAGTEIPHMLALLVEPDEVSRGFRWPAQHESNFKNCLLCTGTNTRIVMGTVFTLLPTFNCATQMTSGELAWKLCRAIQRYGIVLVNTTQQGDGKWGFTYETYSPTYRPVHAEVQTTYGIQLGCMSGCNAATTAYRANLNTLWEALHIVTNNTELTPKGPGSIDQEDVPPGDIPIGPPEA